MSIISEALAKQSTKLATNAKDGKLKLDGQTYSFTFDHVQWVYVVTDEAGELIARFNTKKLTQARQWLREWFTN